MESSAVAAEASKLVVVLVAEYIVVKQMASKLAAQLLPKLGIVPIAELGL